MTERPGYLVVIAGDHEVVNFSAHWTFDCALTMQVSLNAILDQASTNRAFILGVPATDGVITDQEVK